MRDWGENKKGIGAATAFLEYRRQLLSFVYDFVDCCYHNGRIKGTHTLLPMAMMCGVAVCVCHLSVLFANGLSISLEMHAYGGSSRSKKFG